MMTSPLTGKLRAIQQYINHGDDDDDNDQSVFLFYTVFFGQSRSRLWVRWTRLHLTFSENYVGG